MQYSREVEDMYFIAMYRDVMHDIARGYVLKYGASGDHDDHELWDWIFSALHQQRQLKSKERDRLAMELFKSIWNRVTGKGDRHELH
jgi:hypothetical protein